MVANLFGEPVTDATVRKHFPNKRVITRKDRAELAYSLKEDGKKDVKAKDYVLNLKAEYGDGIATLCMIYNATGDTLTLFKQHDYFGNIGEASYPRKIQNGQWAAFLHVDGSKAVVIYRGLNYTKSGGEEYAWLNGWDNVPSYSNKVCAEARKPEHYNEAQIWDWVLPWFKSDYYQETKNGCYSAASITQDNPYTYTGIMSLEGIP